MWLPFLQDISAALGTFAAEHPDTAICTVGILGDGAQDGYLLALDTPEHRDEWAASHKAYGETFCSNPPDFALEQGVIQLRGYPELFRVPDEEPIDFITLDGTPIRINRDRGDEAYDEAVFPFVKAALKDLQPFEMLRRTQPFRVGVSMLASSLHEFWTMPLPA